MRQNQNFYKTPQNSRVPQKSSFELLMEIYVLNQSKQLQELKNQTGIMNDSLAKLTSKVDSIEIHNKMLETQISQVAQQVVVSSQTTGIFTGQTETNPKGHIIVLLLLGMVNN